MLVAYDQHHQMVLAKDAKKVDRLFCYACNEKVILKTGNLRIPHFAHGKGSNCHSFSEGETVEHLLGKQQLYAFFAQLGDQPILEHYFKSIKQRPDLLLMNRKIIEFQCSPISDWRLTERLKGYGQINHKSIWILGRPYLKFRLSHKKIKQFLRYHHQIGFYIMYWDVQTRQLLIHYRIKWVVDQLVYDVITIQRLRDLIAFFKNPPTNQPLKTHTNWLANQLKLVTLKLQKKIINGQVPVKLQTICYQNGYNLAGYPIEMDFPILATPLLGKQLIYYKLALLLTLKRHCKIKLADLIQRTNQLLEIDLSFQMLNLDTILAQINDILIDWQQRGIIDFDSNQITLMQMPKWYSASDLRIEALNERIKKELIN